MSGSSSPDYKALFLKAEERQRQSEERQRQSEERQRQLEEGKKQAEERQRQSEERQRQLEEEKKQLGELLRQERERNRPTTFQELIRLGHDLLWRPLRAASPSRSTTGKIPPPIGKRCPIRLRPWTDCEARQREIYESVCHYLEPTEEDARQLFTSLIALEDHSQQIKYRPLSSEKDLESYERGAVENHVHKIIAELCKIPSAQEEFRLGSGVWFDNHANALHEDDGIDASRPSTAGPYQPDQFCIHRVEDGKSTLLTTVEYKPPHKLSVESLREGLRPMEFWKKVVKPDTIPMEEPEKSRYNAEWLVGSAIVQEYHVMIQEGLEYSYLTNGLMDVQLWVPYDDPGTLYYDLGDPSKYEMAGVGRPRAPKTRIERTLCLCLMSFRSSIRSQAWRYEAQKQLPIWHTSFDSERSQIPAAAQTPSSDHASSKYTSPEPSEYCPSSSSGSSVAQGRRVTRRAASGCAPPSDQYHQEDSSDSEVDPATSAGRKRRFSQVTSSPPTQRSAPRTDPQGNQSGQSRPHVAQYCTQRCLLGLQQGGMLDPDCPNTELHTLGKGDDRHPISAEDLVKKLKVQLDQDLDHNCTPIGPCGSYGAPFKITCATFGYTIVGKGTTSGLWKEVSREAEVYRVLQRAQGSAVPVFLGAIDLAKIYFLHGAGEIRHMLLMGWGGESMGGITLDKTMQRAISRSVKEIRSLGIRHQDLRPDNILWNAELKRALIIDFHRYKLDHRPRYKRTGSVKRLRRGPEDRESERLRVV